MGDELPLAEAAARLGITEPALRKRLQGMAQLRWSRKLRERLGLEVERSAAVVAAEQAEDGVLLALLYLDQWRCIWQADKVADLLEAAATGEAAAVWAVVAAATAGKRAGP